MIGEEDGELLWLRMAERRSESVVVPACVVQVAAVRMGEQWRHGVAPCGGARAMAWAKAERNSL